MKAILLCLLICVTLVVSSFALIEPSCRRDPDRCDNDKCCVEFGPIGYCRPLLKEGEKCELKPLKSSFNKHVYMLKCPCGEGLTCEEDDSGSALLGRCVQK